MYKMTVYVYSWIHTTSQHKKAPQAKPVIFKKHKVPLLPLTTTGPSDRTLTKPRDNLPEIYRSTFPPLCLPFLTFKILLNLINLGRKQVAWKIPRGRSKIMPQKGISIYKMKDNQSIKKCSCYVNKIQAQSNLRFHHSRDSSKKNISGDPRQMMTWYHFIFSILSLAPKFPKWKWPHPDMINDHWWCSR